MNECLHPHAALAQRAFNAKRLRLIARWPIAIFAVHRNHMFRQDAERLNRIARPIQNHIGRIKIDLQIRTRHVFDELQQNVRRFLAGQPDYTWNEEWAAMMRQRTARGERMSRVRIVAEPRSDYTLFGIDLARVNVAAGEDIRYLPRAQAANLDLPGYDFWLIDSRTVGILRFGEDDLLLGAAIMDDPAVVDCHCHWREVAWEAAIPLAEYAA